MEEFINRYFIHGYTIEGILAAGLAAVWWELRKIAKSAKVITKEDLQIYLATREIREKYHKMMKEDGTL